MLIQRHRMLNNEPLLFGSEFMAPPRNKPVPWKDDSGHMTRQPNELAKWTVQYHPLFEIGTVYTMVAGLLNVLVICDAAAGPLIIKPHKKEDNCSRADEQ